MIELIRNITIFIWIFYFSISNVFSNPQVNEDYLLMLLNKNGESDFIKNYLVDGIIIKKSPILLMNKKENLLIKVYNKKKNKHINFLLDVDKDFISVVYDFDHVEDLDGNNVSEMFYTYIYEENSEIFTQRFALNIDSKHKEHIVFKSENYYSDLNNHLFSVDPTFNSVDIEYSLKDLNNDNKKDLVDETTYFWGNDYATFYRYYLFNQKIKNSDTLYGNILLKDNKEKIRILEKNGKKYLGIFIENKLLKKSKFSISNDSSILDFALVDKYYDKSKQFKFLYLKVEDKKWVTAYYWLPNKNAYYYCAFNKISKKYLYSKNLNDNEEIKRFIKLSRILQNKYFKSPIF